MSKEYTNAVFSATKEERFYIECVLAGVDDLTIPKNTEKAKLFAEKYNINLKKNTLEECFEISKKHYEATISNIKNSNEQAALSKERAEYNKLYAKLNAFSDLSGRDKRVAMLSSEISALTQHQEAGRRAQEMLMRSGQQKEHGWGWYGGVADAIAGPAAGIITAMQVEAHNAEIREMNRANMAAKLPAFMSISDQLSDARTSIESLQKKVDETKEKLVGKESSFDVYKYLEITPGLVTVMNNGAHMVTAEIRVPETLYIYDDVPAAVDGTLKAHVYCGDQEVSVVNLVLPVDGVVKSAVLQGMALDGAEKNKDYYVKYTEGNLFLIERYSSATPAGQGKVMKEKYRKATELLADELPEI